MTQAEDFRLAQGRLMLCAAQLGDANVGAEQVRMLIAEMRNAEQVLLANCDEVCGLASAVERLDDVEEVLDGFVRKVVALETKR